jgi:hypothetical protein
MELYETVWNCTELYGTVRNCMELYETVWKCTELYGTVRNCMELYGTVWNCTKLYGTVRNFYLHTAFYFLYVLLPNNVNEMGSHGVHLYIL